MPLVTTTEMFKKAYEGGYAVGAFNVNNMEIVQGITEAASELKAPVTSKFPPARANMPSISILSSLSRRLSPTQISRSRCTLTMARISKSAKPASTAALRPL